MDVDMKPIADLDLYEVLELGRDAEIADVERAYRMAQATWGDDSLATYSLVEEDEAAALRERIELAYRVLSDDDSKRAYDAELGVSPLPPGVEIALDFEPEVSAAVAEVAPETLEFADLEDPGEGPWDGARLRRARLARGIEVERIAEVTKISLTYLRFLEEERFEDLPATVYVRGFVTAYARCVGLDPSRVVVGYMEKLAHQRPEPGPRGLHRARGRKRGRRR